ncbi:MAG TPA: type II toxin-antitoxin system HicA family toxin [Bdellovibrionota bacterium]|nr:type II toxin-antitoxin system HicA family toxin [Bdellovibrionota bacterium]
MKVPSLKPRDLKKLAEEHGWKHARTSGGHWIMTKEGYRSVPISSHVGEFPRSFVRVILKQLGIKWKVGE